MRMNNCCFSGNSGKIEIIRKSIDNRIYYFGNDLGVNYTPEKTVFRFWGPTVSQARLLVFEEESDRLPLISEKFRAGICGTWVAEIEGDLVNKYFIYEVKIGKKINRVVDPYTNGLGTNSNLGLIVDLERTNPKGWENDSRIRLKNYQDAVIYELHVRDFSSSTFSGIKNRGKYLAFTEEGTRSPDGLKTGIDHLKELGITHLHLQPVFDFATVDDSDNTEYNWGYDPYFYNVPEGSYSSNPADDSRVREFKEMVLSLHKNNIGVIMDVVYNHSYNTHNSPFNLLVPGYFYRRDKCGNYTNGSGTGNEIASERPMVRKFIIDSVKYWAEEYHIDGFRFDLMALHDKRTMSMVEKTLKRIDPSIIIYGEPWTGGLSALEPSRQFTKGVQRGKKIAVFNDDFRNAIKGDNDGLGLGFVSGALGQTDNIKRGIVGEIMYNDYICGFADEPCETINYVSSHDNLTLWDKLNKSNYYDDEKTRIKMDRMAQAIIFTSQGIPFIQGGEEILRTKWGNHNSYNAGDRVNQIKWKRKERYYNTFRYYQGLIRLRREHPAFRMKDASQIRKHLYFLNTADNIVGFLIKNNANGDQWRNIVVYHNPGHEEALCQLPDHRHWFIVVNDKEAGTEILEEINKDKVLVPPITTMVLYSDD